MKYVIFYTLTQNGEYQIEADSSNEAAAAFRHAMRSQGKIVWIDSIEEIKEKEKTQ